MSQGVAGPPRVKGTDTSDTEQEDTGKDRSRARRDFGTMGNESSDLQEDREQLNCDYEE